MAARMGVDLADRQAAQFLVPVMPQGAAWPAAGPAPDIQLADYRVDPGRVRLTVQADRAGFLRLAHPIYPTETITRNGEPVAAIGDVFSFIVMPIEAGRNDIEVSAHPSLLRRVCFGVTVVTVLGLVVLLIVSRRRNPEER